MTRSFVAGSILLVFLAACSEPPPQGTAVAGRWYTVEQVELGGQLYQEHCAVCHAADGSSTAEWRTPDADGIYPPPPLNGTAHTWHHPREMLDFTIVNGGAEFGGVMPGFGALLDESQRHAVVAWIQNLWSDEIYTNWKAIDERS
jgi:mono/diheme cytochrome c family protein